MGAIVFIGDELTATGFRLTGIETLVPAPGEAPAALAEARSRADLVLMTAACAQAVPAQEMEQVLAAEQPLVAILPDILQTVPLPDMAARLRAALGIEA